MQVTNTHVFTEFLVFGCGEVLCGILLLLFHIGLIHHSRLIVILNVCVFAGAQI